VYEQSTFHHLLILFFITNRSPEQECRYLVRELQPKRFVSSLGYENNHDGSSYNAPIGYSGLGLKELATPSSAATDRENERQYYRRLLNIREKLRFQTEQSLGMCKGSLFVHYTQVAQKTTGGKHRSHADNCFHHFDRGNATCDTSNQHPWPMRSAASILFLNDDFGGGEFYWANRSNGHPEVLIKAKSGKMTFFTSGVENLHGALPVEENPVVCTTTPRRLVLAMWYTTDSREKELVPNFGEQQDDPNTVQLFEIPALFLKQGALRLSLGLYFLGQQNIPSVGIWALNQPDESTLIMLFKDHSAMLSFKIKHDAIIVHRHVDPSTRPSLMYQLQESVLLQGFLDELSTIAFGEEDTIHNEDRLISLHGMGVIERCRDKLPAKKA
jgi:hypothetical protein